MINDLKFLTYTQIKDTLPAYRQIANAKKFCGLLYIKALCRFFRRMMFMKKIVSVLAACMLACTFTACGSSSGSTGDNESTGFSAGKLSGDDTSGKKNGLSKQSSISGDHELVDKNGDKYSSDGSVIMDIASDNSFTLCEQMAGSDVKVPMVKGNITDISGDTLAISVEDWELDEFISTMSGIAEEIDEEFDPDDITQEDIDEMNEEYAEMFNGTFEYEIFDDGTMYFEAIDKVKNYVEESKKSSLNSIASSVQKAFDSALTDLDVKGVSAVSDSSRIAVYTSDGNYNAANDIELMKYVKQYFDNIDGVKYVVVIENGCVTLAAVAYDWDSDMVGTYPKGECTGMTLSEIKDDFT